MTISKLWIALDFSAEEVGILTWCRLCNLVVVFTCRISAQSPQVTGPEVVVIPYVKASNGTCLSPAEQYRAFSHCTKEDKAKSAVSEEWPVKLLFPKCISKSQPKIFCHHERKADSTSNLCGRWRGRLPKSQHTDEFWYLLECV